VWEWVNDRYASSYDADDTDNPTGPKDGPARVVRGGGWNLEFSFRAADRDSSFPDGNNDLIGFRCARSVGE